MPDAVPESFVLLSSFSGSTKLRSTRLTDGVPSPRSMIQWLRVSKSVMLRTLDQVQKSLPQCHAPYTEMLVNMAAAGFGFGLAAEPATSAASTNRPSRNVFLCIPVSPQARSKVMGVGRATDKKGRIRTLGGLFGANDRVSLQQIAI